MAMACDIRLVAANAQLGQPEIKLGLFPGAGGTQRLPRLVGAGRAKELMYIGDPVSAEEAHRIGLAVSRIGWRALSPDMDLCVNKQHGVFLLWPAVGSLGSCCTVPNRSVKSYVMDASRALSPKGARGHIRL